jgi:hypothetical protein
MMEDEGAIFLVQVLVKPQPRRGTRERALEQRLPLDQRFAPRVGPVELDQVEGPHEHGLVTVPSPDQFNAEGLCHGHGRSQLRSRHRGNKGLRCAIYSTEATSGLDAWRMTMLSKISLAFAFAGKIISTLVLSVHYFR